jgi:tricarballylate dehydrogenase
MQDQEFDAIVVGCGIAGLSAAVAAAEDGARVALLERSTREERGGQTRWTEAYLRMKSESEVSDDFEAHLAENAGGHVDPTLIDAMSGPREHWPSFLKALPIADPDVIGAFADAAGPTIAWLKKHGVRFDFLPTQFLTKTQPRLLPVGGGMAMVEALAGRAEALGVKFFYETAAMDLLRDTDGSVSGVQALARGRRVEFRGRSVVLGSGGFEGNPEMLSQYLGPRSTYVRPISRGGYYNKGEGIRMALAIGAAPCGDFGSYHAEPIDPRSGAAEPSLMIFQYGILVNREGHRFTNEAPGAIDAFYEPVTRRIYEQSEGLAYVVLDGKIEDVPNYKVAIRTDKPAITAPTLEALAERLNIPAETFVATVREYNAACRPGTFKPLEVDGLATQGVEPRKSHWARPLDKAPFIAYPIISANVFTFGGLKVDGRARVLDLDGEPIAGLYAAGEVVGMYHRNYTGATSVLKGAVFGRLAGADAAARPAR